MRKLLHVVGLGLVAIGVSFEFAHASFDDVSSAHPYFSAISYVQSEGIVNGYPDGTFKPNQTINRAEFLKILLETVLTQDLIDDCNLTREKLFSDVVKTDWFAKYTCTGKEAGVVSGYDDGSFRPGKPINFAEAAKILTNSFGLSLGLGAQWYEPFIKALETKKAVPPSVSSPMQNITRGEMAEIIYRLQTGQSSPEVESVTGENFLETSKEEVINLVNQKREEAGLPPMRYNAFLEKAAQAHGDDMQARDYFEHHSPEGTSAESRIKTSGYLDEFEACLCTKSYSVGENLAKGQTTAAEAVETWMNSIDHRINILSPDFSEIGIGISPITAENAGNFQGYFWVQNFGDVNLEQ